MTARERALREMADLVRDLEAAGDRKAALEMLGQMLAWRRTWR